ncbi:MAG: zinc ribbon domain-containing protein [Dehalococcoidia bacterium]
MVVRLLYDLQQVDLALEALQRSLIALEAKIEDTSSLDAARQRVEQARQQERALRHRQRDLELTLGGLEEKVKELEGRMFSGRISNPKELLAMQEEVRLLKRRISETEDSLLQVMEQVEEASQATKAAQEGYASLEAQWRAQRQEWEQEYQRSLQEKAALEQRKALLMQTLEEAPLALYTRLRESKSGFAVAKVERGVCRACGVAVPQSLLQQARGGKEAVRCPSCGRLLYAE